MILYTLLAQTQTYYGSDNQAMQAAASSSPSSDLLSTLSIPIIIGIIIALIFFIIGVVFIVRWWFVQSSIFRMEQDLDVIEDKIDNINNDAIQIEDNNEVIEKKDINKNLDDNKDDKSS